jgi:hypothetical protein
VDRVWHDTAIPFTALLPAFETWLEGHGLWDNSSNTEKLKSAAFVTWLGFIPPVSIVLVDLYFFSQIMSGTSISVCFSFTLFYTYIVFSKPFAEFHTLVPFCISGNWDIKTKIPEQCSTSVIELPAYFNEWINIKDIYLNFYRFKVTMPCAS